MIWIKCYPDWTTTNGKFEPPLGAKAIFVNAAHVRAVEPLAPGVSQLAINLTDHIGRLYAAGEPDDIIRQMSDGASWPDSSVVI